VIDPARADHIAWNALFLTTIIGVLVSVIFSVNAQSIFIALGASINALEHASEYASVMFSGVTVIWVFNVLNSILRGSGQVKLSAFITIAVVCVQIPLMGALVLGWGGYIQLGLVGSPVAILVAFGAGTIVTIVALVRNGSAVRLSRRGFYFDAEVLGAIGGSSAIAGVSPLLNVTTVVVLTGYVGSFGDAALAGYGIGSRLEFLMIPLVFGIGTALTTLVGGNIGANRLDRAYQVAWVGAGSAMLLAGSVGLFFAFFPEAWANHFSQDQAVLSSAHAFLQIAGPGFCFFALGLALFFASQGANRVIWPVIAAALRLIVIVFGANLILANGQASIEMLFGLVFGGMLIYGLTNALSIRFGAWSHGVLGKARPDSPLN